VSAPSSPPAAVESALARLARLHPRLIDLSLERILRLLQRLGEPHRRLPPVIHVAGTNGKGSTIAFLRAIAEAAGLAVHVYTSPHLVRFNERFRLGAAGGGRLVSDAELLAAIAECEEANAGAPITLFEFTTAVGFLLFARHPADLLLLEVGLGGRLDATNVIERALASIITPISLDHIDFLGDSIDKIAAEKAGILKPDTPAFIAAQRREALAVIERQAARLNVPLRIAGEDWTATEERGRLVYQDEHGLLDLPAPRLFGRHQFENAGLAIATLRGTCAARLPAAAFETGMARADWPARLQRLTHGRLAAVGPPGAELWVDGSHNPDGGRITASALADLEERVSRPLVLIVGMLASKDAAGFLANFAGLARRVLTVPVAGQANAVAPEALAAIARSTGMGADACTSIEAALHAAAGLDLAPPPRILITGSLYLAGQVLAANATPPE
jgi:dihydrofolate synthase/folylpolyglutamate synthase